MRIKCSVFIFVMSDVDVECGQNEAEEAITGSQDSKHKINRKQKKTEREKRAKDHVEFCPLHIRQVFKNFSSQSAAAVDEH